MSDGGQKKRKSKGWYRKQAALNKRRKTDDKPGHRLLPGLKGFLVTCNSQHERDAVRECYSILTDYANKLYGPEESEACASGGESDDEDIARQMAKEAQKLKDAAEKGERRFQNSLTGAKNCIFIKTSLEDPEGLVRAIFTDLLQTKVQRARHALRLLPVLGTCKANVKEINQLAQLVLKPFFTETKLEVTYTVNFKARNNSGLGREMVVSTLRKTIEDSFSSCLLRFTPVNPQITVSVEVICGTACITLAREYVHFRKYNLVEVVCEKNAQSEDSKDPESAVQNNETVVQTDSLADVHCNSVTTVKEMGSENDGDIQSTHDDRSDTLPVNLDHSSVELDLDSKCDEQEQLDRAENLAVLDVTPTSFQRKSEVTLSHETTLNVDHVAEATENLS